MKALCTFVCSMMFIFLFVPQAFCDQAKSIEAKVHLQTKADYLTFKALGLDDVRMFKDFADVIVDSTTFLRLQSTDLKIEVLHDDLTAFYQSRLLNKDMGGYMTLSEIEAKMALMHVQHPGITTDTMSIGQTIQGRDIWAIKISDNPNVDEDEPEVLFTAAIHAREVITPLVLFNFTDYLLDNYGTDPDVTDLIDHRELWFIMCVNPDGYYHNEFTNPSGGGLWRKNRRSNGDGTYGVDLNRNFGHEWGYDNAGSSPITDDETYRGTGPFSEPETQAVRDFVESHNFVISMFFHSYQNLLLWPWGYLDGLITPDEDIFEQIGDTVQAFNGYDPGPGWQLYVTNGDSDDWMYGEQVAKNKVFGMTMEVGSFDDGFWPNTSRIPQLTSENLQPCLFLARIAGDIYSLRAPAPPELFVQDTVDSNGFDLNWTFFDTLNPAVDYDLQELQNFESVLDSANSFENWSQSGFELSNARSYSSPTSFFSGVGNNRQYHITTDSYYTVPSDDTLKFRIWYAIEEDWDYGYAEVSTDGVNFTPLAGNITTNTNPNGNNRGNGITGFSSGWVEGRFPLNAYAGQDVLFRISYYTDEYVNEEGFYVDDINPVMGYATKVDYAATDTTYSFTSKPAGQYYYHVRARDAQNQWGNYSAIKPVAVIPGATFTCGDVDDDGAINLIDILYLIDFIYGDPAGPQPDPLISGDADGDGFVNLIDILYLIDFVYSEPPGPGPVCGG